MYGYTLGGLVKGGIRLSYSKVRLKSISTFTQFIAHCFPLVVEPSRCSIQRSSKRQPSATRFRICWTDRRHPSRCGLSFLRRSLLDNRFFSLSRRSPSPSRPFLRRLRLQSCRDECSPNSESQRSAKQSRLPTSFVFLLDRRLLYDSSDSVHLNVFSLQLRVLKGFASACTNTSLSLFSFSFLSPSPLLVFPLVPRTSIVQISPS